MPFVRPSIETIKDRIEKGIEARLFGHVALLRNAVLRILARVFAGSIHGNYGYLEWLSRMLFVVTAETEYLDRHGIMWGIPRLPGSFASGNIIFSGVNGVIIPEDTRVQNEDGIEYGTTVQGTVVAGFVDIAMQAIEDGDVGNDSTSTTLQLLSPIVGIDDEVAVSGAITGGADSEDDETYRARILQRIQTIPAGGSSADYVRWATSVAGVARAWCYPLYTGPGTVATVITASGADPVPSIQLLSDVDGYILVRKPVTAVHTTESITDSSDVAGKALMSLWISYTPFDAGYQDTILGNIRTLFLPHRPGTDIPLSQLRTAIATSGVVDYEITAIQLDAVGIPLADIVLTGFQYPWLDNVVFTELL